MGLKFLSGHTPSGAGSSSAIKHWDIRLDTDYIVLRGLEDEASSVPLAGRLVLCLAEPLNVTRINLTFSGIIHMSYQVSSASALTGRRTSHREQAFFEKTWTFRDANKGKAEAMVPDNYDWPFEVILPGNLPESVVGLPDAHVTYRLKAEISRKRGKDIVIRKPVRLVRTLGSTALELTHAMSVENVWPNKIEYSISTPSKAVIFGSFLRIDFKLIPLLKGLIIGTIMTQVKEEQERQVDPDWAVNALDGGRHKQDRIVAWDRYRLDPDQDEQIIDETAEGYQFSRYLELPKSLSRCLQDCDVKGIKVRHKIKFNVQLHNPDGHVSELRANLPISLYISPNLPLGANGDLVDQSAQASRAAVENDLTRVAPPLYGQHTMDQLYSAVDMSGYLTPGMATSPSTPNMRSRTGSSENLAGRNATVEHATQTDGYVSAAALQRRLQDLRVADNGLAATTRCPHDSDQPRSGNLSRRNSHPGTRAIDIPVQDATDQESMPQLSLPTSTQGSDSDSRSQSVQISRQTSREEERHVAFVLSSGAVTPLSGSNHFEELTRTPSYNTAVKTPVPATWYARGDGLPTYGMAITQCRPAALTQPPATYRRSSSYDDARLGATDPLARPGGPFRRTSTGLGR